MNRLVPTGLAVLCLAGCGLVSVHPARSTSSLYERNSLPDLESRRRVEITIEPPDPTPVETGEAGPDLIVEPTGRVTAPPRARVEVAIQEAEKRRGGEKSNHRLATAQNAGLIGEGVNPQVLTASPPETVLNGQHRACGGQASFAFWEQVEATGAHPLFWLGGLGVLAGSIVLVWFKNTWTSMGLLAAGGTLIAAGVVSERYPWVALAVPLAGVAALVWFLLAGKKGRDVWETLKTVVGAVEVAEGGASVKQAVAQQAAGSAVAATVKAVVTQAKQEIA